ncbi:glycosyltransferase [Tenacibaculum sp. 190524A05c]|uniref:glycosyltransferase n=1 Tax=Tenacibaculum platacis TaxID=3137852 RepID=UPI0031FB93F2
MKKDCLIYNYAQHYRLGIFKLMDKEIQCDFYFGDKMGDVKKIDYKELKGFKKELKNISLISNFYWQKGALGLLFKKYKRYILLGEYYCLSTWVFLLLAKLTSKKVVLWTHGWYGKETKIIGFIKKIFFSLADDILLYGNHAKKLMINEGFSEDKLHVIYNSLNYNKQIEVRDKLKKANLFSKYFSNNYPVLIFIGRLTKVKKLNYIIEAQNKMFNEGFPVNLVIIGDGEEKSSLLNKVEKFDLQDNVWFVGQLYDEESIAKYIYNSDLCVSPGNVGLTAMHSLVYGTPVITHDNFKNQMPEFESIEDGITGTFFKEDNIDDLVEKIRLWLEKANRAEIRKSCNNKIDHLFNPNYQINVIKRVLFK